MYLGNLFILKIAYIVHNQIIQQNPENFLKQNSKFRSYCLVIAEIVYGDPTDAAIS